MNYGLLNFGKEKEFFGGLLDEFIARAKATPGNFARDPVGALLSGFDTAQDFSPVIGGVKGTKESLEAGDPGMAVFNALTVPMDLFAPGSGVAAKAAGAKLIPELAGLLGMTAWHGSPHKWSKVDLSKVGTGEGAQAYGHGFYAAEDEAIAKHYRDTLGVGSLGGDPAKKGSIADRLANMFGNDGTEYMRGDRYITDYANKFSQNKYTKNGDTYYVFPDGSEIIDNGNVWDAVDTSKYLYELDIPDSEIDKMLDWDAPLSEHPEIRDTLRQALKTDPAETQAYKSLVNKYGESVAGRYLPIIEKRMGEVLELVDSGEVGGTVYKRLADAVGGGSYENASNFLNSLGIPGIKYFDGNSRRAGEGTRNFVLFNEDTARVLSRNGEPLEQGLLSMEHKK